MQIGWRPPILETDRLVLGPVAEGDALGVFAACSNPAVTRYTLFDTHGTIEDSLTFIRNFAGGNYADMIPDPFAVTLKGDPQVIGAVGCQWASRPHHVMELGYWLAEHLWGRGIIPEAAAAVVRFVFANYPVERLQARVIVGNVGSARVLEKLGFRYEGTQRSAVLRRGAFEDIMMFATLRADHCG